MNTKTGVGTYLYNTGNAGPHAVSRIKDPAAPAWCAVSKEQSLPSYSSSFERSGNEDARKKKPPNNTV